MTNQNEADFVSFMIEKDDSYLFTPLDEQQVTENDDDYYRQLSRQFYGSKHQEQSKKQPKSVIDQAFIKSRTLKTIKCQPPHSVSEQLQQQIQKLLSTNTKPKIQPTSLQNSFKSNIQKLNTLKLAYQQIKTNPSRKIVLPKQQQQESRTFRLRLEDNEQFTHFHQNSYRSTLNSSTKSSAKQEQYKNLYFPAQLKTDRSIDKKSNFKLSFRPKQ